MRPLLPLLAVAVAACGAFNGSDKHASSDSDPSNATADSGTLAEAKINPPEGKDSSAPAIDPCREDHLYCNDFEQDALKKGFSGEPVTTPADGSVPPAAIVPLPAGGHAGSFSLGAVAPSQTVKNWIGNIVRDAPGGKIRVSVDMQIVVGTWPVNAQMPFFVVSLPTAADSGLLTLAVGNSKKLTMFRQLSSSSTDGISFPTQVSSPVAMNEWFHLEIAVGDRVTVKMVRADGQTSTPIDEVNDIAMTGSSPTIILGPAHYPGQGDLSDVAVLYDNVVVDGL